MSKREKEDWTEKGFYAQEFCRITGLKADTLRFYVDKGLISPEVNPENQYKIYSAQDVVDMAFVRSRRAMGAPIFKINEVLTKLSPDEQLDWYMDYEEQLLSDMKQLQERLERCQKVQRDLRNLSKLLYQIIDQSGTEGPDLWQLNLIGPHASKGNKKYILAERWREAYPHVLSMIHIPLDELSDQDCEKYSVTMGMVLPTYRIDQMPEMMQEPAYPYPSQDCIGMMIRLEDPFCVTRADLQPLLDYAEEKGYRLIDDMTSWLFARTMEEGKNYYYYAMRISVDKSEAK